MMLFNVRKLFSMILLITVVSFGLGAFFSYRITVARVNVNVADAVLTDIYGEQ